MQHRHTKTPAGFVFNVKAARSFAKQHVTRANAICTLHCSIEEHARASQLLRDAIKEQMRENNDPRALTEKYSVLGRHLSEDFPKLFPQRPALITHSVHATWYFKGAEDNSVRASEVHRRLTSFRRSNV
jgi:hypothetical protein